MVRGNSHGEKQAGSPAEAAITEIETNLLWKVSHLISGSMLQDDVIQTSLQGVVDSTGCDVAILFLRRDGDLELKAMVPTETSIRMDEAVGHRIGECLCGLAARDGIPVYSIDITRDPRCTFQECKDAGMRSFAAIPMKNTGGALGVLGLASRTARDFERQAAFLETLTTVISIGVRNSLQHEEALRYAAALETEIQERKRAEEAVRHSEAQLRSFVANSPFGISSASILQDRFLSANPATVKMLGYDSEKELLALRITRDVYCQPEGRRAFLAQLPHSGDFSGIETHWRRKDKKQIIVRSSGRVIRNPEVPDEGIIEGIQEDVTQQRMLEEQLAPRTEDGGGGKARGRHRARLQQSDDGHHGADGIAAAGEHGRCDPAAGGECPGGGAQGRRVDKTIAGVQPQADDPADRDLHEPVVERGVGDVAPPGGGEHRGTGCLVR